MDLHAGVFVRLEFPSPAELGDWVSRSTDLEDLAPQDEEDDLFGYVEDGAMDGDLDDFPDSIEGILALLRSRSGWTVTVVGSRVEMLMDGAAAEDFRLVESGLANGLYFHAVERGGADGYFYIVQGMHADGGADLDAAWLCRGGTLLGHFPGDEHADIAEFRENFEARITAVDALWSAPDEERDGPWIAEE